MNYLYARNRIDTGDLVAVKRTNHWFWRLVTRITGSPYTHTAIVIWLDGGLYVAEMDWSGNRLVPLSQFTAEFDVFACPVNRAEARERVCWALRHRIRYSLYDLLRIGLDNLINLRLPSNNSGMVCSGFSNTVYQCAGWNRAPAYTPSPGSLVTALGITPRLRVTHG